MVIDSVHKSKSTSIGSHFKIAFVKAESYNCSADIRRSKQIDPLKRLKDLRIFFYVRRCYTASQLWFPYYRSHQSSLSSSHTNIFSIIHLKKLQKHTRTYIKAYIHCAFRLLFLHFLLLLLLLFLLLLNVVKQWVYIVEFHHDNMMLNSIFYCLFPWLFIKFAFSFRCLLKTLSLLFGSRSWVLVL